MAEAFPISGSIDPKAFPFLLMDLHRQGATGSLKVDGPSYQKALYFRSGRILFGSSNDPRDQLGAILIESGRITPEQLEEVNAKVGTGNPLAKVLADSGFVSQRELGEAARAKVERILSDVIAYDSGSFEFEDGVLPKGAVDLKLSSQRLVLAAVQRIVDRAFVLRHLASLEAVLAPTDALAAARAEIQPDAAGLPDALDGRRTLKEAAARAHLDEFEAAKIACALMFLGLVQATARPDQPVSDLLDLGQTARMAFDNRPAGSQPATVIMDGPGLPPPSVPGGEVGFAFVEASPRLPEADPEPIVIDADPPPIYEAPTLMMPEPPKPAAALPRPAPPPGWPRPATRPPAVPAPQTELVVAPPTRPPSRPSKDDLAALDALLNSRSVEGPLAPLEKPPQAWEPRFGQHSSRVARRTGSGLRLPLVGVGILVLLGSAGLAWRFLGASTPNPPATRPAPSTPAPSQAAATPNPSDVAAASTAPSPAPLPPDLTLPASPVPSQPAPTTPASAPATRTTPAPAANAAPTLADARALLRQGRLPEAAQAFATNLRQSASSGFSIQLLVACSADTVEKALANVSDPDLYLLPVNYKGRPCYRVCWGLYESEPRADSAVRAVPDYFRKSGSAPRVVPTAGLLP